MATKKHPSVYQNWGIRSRQTVCRGRYDRNFRIRDGLNGEVVVCPSEIDSLIVSLMQVRARAKGKKL